MRAKVAKSIQIYPVPNNIVLQKDIRQAPSTQILPLSASYALFEVQPHHYSLHKLRLTA